MNFWKTVLAVLTLGAVGGARADDVTSRQLGVSNPIDTDNNNIGGGVPIPEPNRFLTQAPQVQIVEESKDLAETYDQLFRYLDVGQKNRGAVDNAKWNAALEKLMPDQQAFFVQLKELQKPQKQRRLRDGRVLDIAGVVCQPVNLFLGLDGSNTQGQLSIVKQAGSQTMGEVTPVNTGVIVFGNVARVIVPFGPAGSVTANQAVISSIPPGVAGPGTNIAALFDAFLVQLQANPITNNYPIIFEIMSDYKNTVGNDAGVVAAYTRLANYVKATYPNNEFKVVGFAVPGASGTDLALAQQTSRDFYGKPDAALYPTAPQLLDGVTAENNEFCVVPPLATAVPTTQPSVPGTSSPTESVPPDIVPPVVAGTILTGLAALALIPWKRKKLNKPDEFTNGEALEVLTEARRILEDPETSQETRREVASAILNPRDPRENDVNAIPNRGVESHQRFRYNNVPIWSGGIGLTGDVRHDQGVVQLPSEPAPKRTASEPPVEEREVPAKAKVDDYDNHYSLLSIIIINHLINRFTDRKRDVKYEDSKYVIPIEVRNVPSRLWNSIKGVDRNTPARMKKSVQAGVQHVREDGVMKAAVTFGGKLKGSSVADKRTAPPPSAFKSAAGESQAGATSGNPLFSREYADSMSRVGRRETADSEPRTPTPFSSAAPALPPSRLPVPPGGKPNPPPRPTMPPGGRPRKGSGTSI